MTRPNSRLSLRTELLANFAVLAIAALVFAVGAVVLFYDQAEAARGALYISVLVAADVVVLVAFCGWQINRLIIRPLRETAAATEAIADGDLRRRVSPYESLGTLMRRSFRSIRWRFTAGWTLGRPSPAKTTAFKLLIISWTLSIPSNRSAFPAIWKRLTRPPGKFRHGDIACCSSEAPRCT